MGALTHALLGDWHDAVWAAVKALCMFLTAAAAFRFTQRRAIAEFTPFDWVTAVAVGAIVGRTATAADTAWLTGAAALPGLVRGEGCGVCSRRLAAPRPRRLARC